MQVPFIDVHCHLAAPEFDQDRDDVLKRAQDEGLAAAVVVGEDYDDNLRVLEITDRYPYLFAGLGHHPWRLEKAAQDVPKTLALLEEHRDRVVAIGEVGLDYRTVEDRGERANLRDIFRDFIEASKVLDLPLSVHGRSAGRYVLEILHECEAKKAALHAFDGKLTYLRSGVQDGYFFSIPGSVLVSPQKRKLAEGVPASKMLFESDSPALAPERGARNEPSVIAQAIETTSQIRKRGVRTIAETAYENARMLFSLPVRPFFEL